MKSLSCFFLVFCIYFCFLFIDKTVGTMLSNYYLPAFVFVIFISMCTLLMKVNDGSIEIHLVNTM